MALPHVLKRINHSPDRRNFHPAPPATLWCPWLRSIPRHIDPQLWQKYREHCGETAGSGTTTMSRSRPSTLRRR